MGSLSNPIRALIRQGVCAVVAALTFSMMLGLYTAFTQLWPASWWVDVQSVYVHDTSEGTPPEMDVVRIVNRPFYARWLVEVERETPDGWTVVCPPMAGENSYDPSNVLPKPLTLDWWTWPAECRPEAGRYQVETRWTIVSPFWPNKEVVIRSNTFTITP
jgi:hypothetical protein